MPGHKNKQKQVDDRKNNPRAQRKAKVHKGRTTKEEVSYSLIHKFKQNQINLFTFA